MKKKVVPKLRQEVKVKVDIVTSDDIKIYYAVKFQDFTVRYIIENDMNSLPVNPGCERSYEEIFRKYCSNQGPYSPTIFKNILCLFLQTFVHLNVT